MGFTTIQTSFNDAEANLLKSRLELAGFHPFLKGEDATLLTTAATTGGIRIQVPDEEAAAASEFITQEANGTDESSDS